MSERTPPLGTVRHAWAKGHPFPLTTEIEDRYAEFDRWLAAHVAEKRAEWEAEQGDRVPEGAKITYWTELDGDYAEESATLAQADYVRREARGHIAVADRKIWKHVEFDVVVPVPDTAKAMIRCDYCGDDLPSVRSRADIPTTPNLQRLGFAADKIVCPECVARVRSTDTTNNESEG